MEINHKVLIWGTLSLASFCVINSNSGTI
jgi:hypothetical protein